MIGRAGIGYANQTSGNNRETHRVCGYILSLHSHTKLAIDD